MIRVKQWTTGALTAALVAGAQLAWAQTSKPPAQTPNAPAAAQKAPDTAESRELNLRAYSELIRSDIRGQKAAIISEVMEFSEADDAKFWPIYRDYETELTKLNDERLAGIKDYADHYDALSDEVADRLVKKSLELESRRNQLKAAYYDKFKSALSAKTAARFLQVENQILLLLDLQIASSLPVVSR